MISYRVEVRCNGCGQRFAGHFSDSDIAGLPELALLLDALVADSSWSTDRGAHFCPHCTHRREATEPLLPRLGVRPIEHFKGRGTG